MVTGRLDDESLGEVFIHWGKHGTSAAGLASSYAIALSLGLRHHVPLTDLIRSGLDQFFVPNGHTDDPEIPKVRSAVDYIARRLAIDWLPYPERTALGVYTLTERVHRASTWIEAHEPSRPGPGRPGERAPVSGHRGHGEQPHAWQPLDYLDGGQTAFVGDDAPQVRAPACRAAVQELLQAVDLL